MNWYLGCWKKYATFEGRARRKEYWMFVLVNMVAAFIVGLIDGFMGTSLFVSVYSLAVFLPSLAVSVRRLHDTNRSGWWLLIGLIPVVGNIVLLIFMCCDSTLGSNRFGRYSKI